MRVLWITNIMLPPICEALNIKVPVTGGWMYSSLKNLQKFDDLEFAVATVYNGREFVSRLIGNTTYYLLPIGNKNNQRYLPHLEPLWHRVNQEFKPDIIHIHGTEYTQGLAYIRACGNKGVVVSIQGLVSVCERYYLAGISPKEIRRSITFRDIIKQDNIFQQQRKFHKREIYETEYLQSVNHVIGRTSWDKTHIWAVNPKTQYHFCNETLRDEFYRHEWNYAICEKHSIFISQALYPIKGLHQVLKAMPIIRREYPDVKLYVSGGSVTNAKWYRMTGYGQYLKKVIRKLNLADVVHFTGILTEKEMCSRFLKSNVFVCSSSIENSPNSLGEAQLLGVPCIASYIGGVPDMMQNNELCMYRFEETEMLAEKVCTIFSQGSEANVMSRTIAAERHNPTINSNVMHNIYNEISNKN